MNKIIKIAPLMLSLIVLASCGETSGSEEISSSGETSSALPTELTQDLINEYRSGYAIEGMITETYDYGDGYTYELYYAFDAECTEEGYHYKQGNYSEDMTTGFDAGILYEGNFEPYTLNSRVYVSDWTLLIDNNIGYSVYNQNNILWEDTFENFFGYMSVNDFTETSTGVWSYDFSLNTFMAGLIYSQMYGYWGGEVTVFDLYVEDGAIVGYHAEIDDMDYTDTYGFTVSTSYDGSFAAAGSDLYVGVSVKDGTEKEELETALASLRNNNYTVSEDISVYGYDYNTNTYSYSSYYSNTLTSDGTNVESSDSEYELPSFEISSVLFEGSNGVYSLDVEGSFYATTVSFDPFTYYEDVFDELTIEISEESIVFTAYDNVYGLRFTLTYTNIGSTVISAE